VSILIVDDEEHRVHRLIRMLRAADLGMPIEYVSSSEDVVELMDSLATETRKPCRALITDHNMDGLTGKQLLQVVTGRLEHIAAPADLHAIVRWDEVADRALREHLEANFQSLEHYRVFCARHTALVKVLYSSEPWGDGINDLPGDIPFVLKVDGSEPSVIELLHDEGIVDDEAWSRAMRRFGRSKRR